jgi:hypothetical protein
MTAKANIEIAFPSATHKKAGRRCVPLRQELLPVIAHAMTAHAMATAKTPMGETTNMRNAAVVSRCTVERGPAASGCCMREYRRSTSWADEARPTVTPAVESIVERCAINH